MARSRPPLQPFTADGPILVAILNVLDDLHDLIDERFPKQEPVRGTQVMATQMASGYEPPSMSLDLASPDPAADGSATKVTEPAPGERPGKAVPVSEPAPDVAPGKAVPVEEPDPDDAYAGQPPEPALPDPPPRAGRGSSLTAWQAWADLAQVGYDGNASRDDVIAACVEAGVLAE